MRTKHDFKNPLIDTLVKIKGNQRVALFTEPLYGIPFNLYTPFVSIYMAALGLSPVQIGVISMITLLSQMVSSVFAGVVTDKLGRRKALFYCDLIGWVIPFLLWTTAQSFTAFVIAASLNGLWRISNLSYTLLMVEDAEEKRIPFLFGLINLASLVAGFVSPLAYVFVRKYSLVPTMRVLYLTAMVLMIIKNFFLYFGTYDTDIAKRRMADSKNTGIFSKLIKSKDLFYSILKNRQALMAVGLMTAYLIIKTVNDSFWPLYATDRIGIEDEALSIYNTIRSLVMLLSTIFIYPKISVTRFKFPLFASFSVYIAVGIMYSLLPVKAYTGLILGTLLEAFALSVIIPMTNTLLTATIEQEERSMLLGFALMISLLVSAPFGLIAGWLSKLNRILPLIMSAVIACIACVNTLHLDNLIKKEGINN
ncbi:MAG: MFS transporter [Eubacteriales bacterium]|nr:MFS transporter [Eubacteriales bacterium]